MNAVHFGAGNIGRGFIGEILHNNGMKITFIDVNDQIITALKEKNKYEIGLADETKKLIPIDSVTGLNNQLEPEKVIEAIVDADTITTAIGPNILPFIAELLAQGINERSRQKVSKPIDVVACENMIGGSSFFKNEVLKHNIDLDYLTEFVGFPDAAVDRIVPEQSHEDPLFVEVEPFSEWVINETQMRNPELKLTGVHYVNDLQPFIERKLFSVNTGHATVAYTGALLGYETIDEAMEDSLVLAQLKSVLTETGSLLIKKWHFDPEEHEEYIQKIINRFQNKYISDAISRVARTPIRKLGHEERFIRPIRELHEYGLDASHLIGMVGMIFNYHDSSDEESQRLTEMLNQEDLMTVVTKVTGIKNQELIDSIIQDINRYAKVAA